MRVVLAPLCRCCHSVTRAIIRDGSTSHVSMGFASAPGLSPGLARVSTFAIGAMLVGVAIIPFVALNYTEELGAYSQKLAMFAGFGFALMQVCKPSCWAVM